MRTKEKLMDENEEILKILVTSRFNTIINTETLFNRIQNSSIEATLKTPIY